MIKSYEPIEKYNTDKTEVRKIDRPNINMQNQNCGNNRKNNNKINKRTEEFNATHKLQHIMLGKVKTKLQLIPSDLLTALYTAR